MLDKSIFFILFFQDLHGRLQDKDERIDFLEREKMNIREELHNKTVELVKLKEAYHRVKGQLEGYCNLMDLSSREKLQKELRLRENELKDKNTVIEQLTRELNVKTQNLQKLVNTELWSKNKEIAKLHNYMSSSQEKGKSDLGDSAAIQLAALIKALTEVGIDVKINDQAIQLSYSGNSETIDLHSLSNCIQRLNEEKSKLENDVDYKRWVKTIASSQVDDVVGCEDKAEKTKKHCELLRSHLKSLVKIISDTLKNAEVNSNSEEFKKIIIDALVSSNILTPDFINALQESQVDKDCSDDFLEILGNSRSQLFAAHSDSEAFSEPDRMVSQARMGFHEPHQSNFPRSRYPKYSNTLSDSEDSVDFEYLAHHKIHQADGAETMDSHIRELKETNSALHSELSALRHDFVTKAMSDSVSWNFKLFFFFFNNSK